MLTTDRGRTETRRYNPEHEPAGTNLSIRYLTNAASDKRREARMLGVES